MCPWHTGHKRPSPRDLTKPLAANCASAGVRSPWIPLPTPSVVGSGTGINGGLTPALAPPKEVASGGVPHWSPTKLCKVECGQQAAVFTEGQGARLAAAFWST